MSRSAAPFATARPVGTLPISARRGTRGCATSAAPHGAPPVTRLITPGGARSPISSIIRYADSGACCGGFMITVLPAISGGPIFAAVNISGWLYATMRATTPNGSRTRHVDGAAAHRDRLAAHLERQARAVVELRRGGLHVAAHLGDRVAAVARIEQRELVRVLAQLRGDRAHDRRALERLRRAPRGERRVGGRDGGVDVARVRFRARAERPAGGRIDRVAVAAVRRVPRTAVEEVAMRRQAVVAVAGGIAGRGSFMPSHPSFACQRWWLAGPLGFAS